MWPQKLEGAGLHSPPSILFLNGFENLLQIKFVTQDGSQLTHCHHHLAFRA